MGAINITYRKEMERELQRTQILESLGILAGGIGHDFNNILAGIYGNSQLARKRLDRGESVAAYLKGIERATDRAVSLARQLLTFAKGGAPVRKIASITEIVRETADFALRGSNVNCSFGLPAGLWPCHVDPGQISQVMHNLIINAAQAMPNGGTIEVTAANMEIDSGAKLPLTQGRYLRLSVRDHGVGIPREYIHRIFEPYFTTKQKGVGLGLAVSYSIIAKHGGYITASSEQGGGATFTIYLPASMEPLPAPNKHADVPFEGGGHILLVDDDDIVREVGKEILADLGYQVTALSNGSDAIEVFAAARLSPSPIDAVILDLTIPGGMGGKETLQRLRRIAPDIKAIVSSGYSDDPVMANPESYGFMGVISKPYDIDEMAALLRKILGAGKSERQ
jgi:CheY-like chemotaxis protein